MKNDYEGAWCMDHTVWIAIVTPDDDDRDDAAKKIHQVPVRQEPPAAPSHSVKTETYSFAASSKFESTSIDLQLRLSLT
jgi:hypothetical protein